MSEKVTIRAISTSLFVQILLLSFLFPSNAISKINPGTMTFSLNIGQYIFEGKQNIENGTNYGLSLSYNVTEKWTVEGLLDKIDTEVKSIGVGVDGTILRFEGNYNIFPDRKIVPYLAAGIGGIYLDYETAGSDTGFLFDYGGGIKYFVSKSVSLRGDLRHVLAYSNPLNNFIASLGISISFGRGKKARPIHVGKPTPIDSDADGVSDESDHCPGTAPGVEVDVNGCPKPLERPVSLTLNIEFKKNSSEIAPIYHEVLKKVADFLKSHPGTEATVEGHTDNKGKASYNMKLSAKRAQSVVDYIVDTFGIDGKRLKAVGYGESRPIADNATAEGRSQNRRVTVEIYSTKGK